MEDGSTPRLSERQEEIWRNWLRLNTLLPAHLNRQLQVDDGLSLPDFDVLVQLTDSPEGRLRVTELARALEWERSRLSHHVGRMQRAGLVCREECETDRRGAFVVLTKQGRAAIERAAPVHVRTVRRLFVDALSEQEIEALDATTTKLLARLGRS
jgi:DNA-binding MarR family transcriptional regulator